MIPEAEYKRISKIVYVGLTNNGSLTAWDLDFLNDFSAKIEKYKRHVYISDKQDEQFSRIEKYLQEELGDSYDD